METEEKAEKLAKALGEKIPSNIDISVVEGNQPVYYYIISVE